MTDPGNRPDACDGPAVYVRRASFFGRMRGLLGRPAPAPGHALWITPCRQVHTFGMRYPIDVVHLGVRGEVLRVDTLRPWRLGTYVWRAEGVLELREGEAGRVGLTPGVRPRLIRADTHAS